MNFVRNQERNSHTVAVSSSLNHVELGSAFFPCEANTQEPSVEPPAAQGPESEGPTDHMVWVQVHAALTMEKTQRLSKASRGFLKLVIKGGHGGGEKTKQPPTDAKDRVGMTSKQSF